MVLKEFLQTIIDNFDFIKEDDEKIGFINEKQIIFLTNDESIKGKSYKESRLIKKGIRKNIIMGSSKGQMLNIKPVYFNNEIISVYIFFSKPERIEHLGKLIDKIIFDIASKVDYIDDGTIKLDLDTLKPKIEEIPITRKENKPPKKKKAFTKKMLKNLIVEKDSDYIRAYLFISPFSNYSEFSEQLKSIFKKSEDKLVNEGLLLFTKETPSEDISSFIKNNNCTVLCSHRFDAQYKDKILQTLLSLYYVPEPIKKSGIISFEDNEEKASIILSYLNNPYLYYQEIKSLHHLEKNQNLYNSFIAYVSNHFNFNKTCELLRVHRNTIYNRLKKISEMFNKKDTGGPLYFSLYSLYILSQSFKNNFLPDITSKDVVHL